jgi:hypothetical protein
MATTCYRCGVTLRFDAPVGRRTTCPDCDADLHSCINCKHYDETAAHMCREPHAEHFIDKEQSNACELFMLGDGASRRRSNQNRAAKNALAALFGEAPKDEPDASPRDALDALFKKK